MTHTSPQEPMMPPLQVSIREAGRLLSYDERTIRRLLQRGDLRSVGQGKMRRIAVSDIRDWQRRNQG